MRRAVTGACGSPRRRGFALEVHVALDWGVRAPVIGAAVQKRVSEYLVRTAKVRSVEVEVVVDDVTALPAGD